MGFLHHLSSRDTVHFHPRGLTRNACFKRDWGRSALCCRLRLRALCPSVALAGRLLYGWPGYRARRSHYGARRIRVMRSAFVILTALSVLESAGKSQINEVTETNAPPGVIESDTNRW